MSIIPTITPSEIPALMSVAQARTWNIYLHGAPGVGKSAIVLTTAKKMAADQGLDFYHVGKDPQRGDKGWENTFAFIDLRVATLDALDVKGAPKIEGENTVFKVPSMLPDVMRHGKFGVLFLDELPQGSPSVTNSLTPLIHDRIMGEKYRLPDGWQIVAAGNRKEDQANTSKLGAQVYNRFMHFNVNADVKSWAEYQITQGSDGRVPAYVRMVPSDLHSYKKNDIAFATPRQWSKVDELVSEEEIKGDLLEQIIASLIGTELAGKIVGFLLMIHQLPTWNEISKSPDTARLPEPGAEQIMGAYYAIMGMCGNRADFDTIDNAMTYVARIPNREIQQTFVLELQIKKPELMASQAVSKWRSLNNDIAV
jgi:MoxR-like ATPase